MRESSEILACYHEAESSRTKKGYDIGKSSRRDDAHIRDEGSIDRGEKCGFDTAQEINDCCITKDLKEIDQE